jgi:hypothetical protein
MVVIYLALASGTGAGLRMFTSRHTARGTEIYRVISSARQLFHDRRDVTTGQVFRADFVTLVAITRLTGSRISGPELSVPRVSYADST